MTGAQASRLLILRCWIRRSKRDACAPVVKSQMKNQQTGQSAVRVWQIVSFDEALVEFIRLSAQVLK
jgi:hypothetical protein